MTLSAPAPLAVTMGDPAGCGPQITMAAWQARQALDLPPFYVIGDIAAYSGGLALKVIADPAEAAPIFDDALPILPLQAPTRPITPGQPDIGHAAAILESIEIATRHALSGRASAVVTNPISKATLYSAGFKHPGHTEYLAALCAAENAAETKPPVMMLVGGGLRVALMTIHIPLMQVAARLSEAHILETAQTVNRSLRRDFGIQRPRIALSGLNPHAGEAGTIGREETDLINPTAEKLRAIGLDVSNARPGDTVFYEALTGAYDAVIAMSHDQGLIPVKTLDFWGGVNTTLGLPIIRTSPDHGTAYDAAAAATCRADSLNAALRLAADMVKQRQMSDA